MKTFFGIFLLTGLMVNAKDLQIAVASNFSVPLQGIVAAFEAQSEFEVGISPGSTGKHFAQIINGAPFDLFFAADIQRPQLLEEKGIAVENSRFTYAIGRLVLWSPDPDRVDAEGKVLSEKNFNHLAIANPKLAPYGLAAREVLQNRGLWEELQPRIVRGSNIAQTAHFVQSGAAEVGFVALSQIQTPGKSLPGSFWLPPTDSYTAIHQQAVILNPTPAAVAFIAFMQTEKAQQLIRSYGYDLPATEKTDHAVPGRS